MTKRLGVETISGWWDQTGAYGKPGNGTGNGNGTLIRQIHECFKLRSMIDINPTPFFAFLAHKMGDDTRGGSKILVAGHWSPGHWSLVTDKLATFKCPLLVLTTDAEH